MRKSVVLCLVVWPGWGQAATEADPGAWLRTQVTQQNSWVLATQRGGFHDAILRPERAHAIALWSIGCRGSTAWSTCQALHEEQHRETMRREAGPSRNAALFASTLILGTVWTFLGLTTVPRSRRSSKNRRRWPC